MESITHGPSLLEILGTIGLTLAGFIAQKFVVPFLSVGKREKYARFIATIANEVIDDLKARYPEKKWLEHLDEAVQTLAEICGVSPDIARRAINAAAGRR